MALAFLVALLVASSAGPPPFFALNRTDTVLGSFNTLLELTFKVALILDRMPNAERDTAAYAAGAARAAGGDAPRPQPNSSSALRGVAEAFVVKLGVEPVALAGRVNATTRPIRWHGYAGRMPALPLGPAAGAVLQHSARVEAHIVNALPRPYDQRVGAVWTLWTLLARMALFPTPGAFNLTARAMASRFREAASAVQPLARQLFGDDFFSLPMVELTNRYPQQLRDALLLSGGGGARAVDARTARAAGADGRALLAQRPRAAGGGDGGDAGGERARAGGTRVMRGPLNATQAVGVGAGGPDGGDSGGGDGATKAANAAEQLAARFRKQYYAHHQQQRAEQPG
eukprot:g1158.t1